MTEQHNQVAVVPQIVEYQSTAAAMYELRTKFENVIFPVETAAGMKDAKEARRKLRELRVSLEKMRKDIKEPALRRCQLIDSEAKDITAQLTALEEPIDKQIKLEEDRKEREKAEKERVERERVEGIKSKIDAISRLPLDSANDKAEEITTTIHDLEGVVLTAEEFAEFLDEAFAAKQAALSSLRDLLVKVQVREEEVARLASERAELERLKAEAAERERKLQEEREAIAKERAELEAMKKAKDNPPSQPVETSPVDIPQEAEPVAAVGPHQTEFVDETTDQETLTGDFNDADAITRELANYTAMQFFAMAKKVRAVGNEIFAGELETVAQNVQSGGFDTFIKAGNWLDMANADKEMALASHACVSIICGDEDLGPSILRAA